MIEIKEMGRKIYPAEWLFRHRGPPPVPEGKGTLVISIASQEFPNPVVVPGYRYPGCAHCNPKSFYAKAFVPDALLDAEFDNTGAAPFIVGSMPERSSFDSPEFGPLSPE